MKRGISLDNQGLKVVSLRLARHPTLESNKFQRLLPPRPPKPTVRKRRFSTSALAYKWHRGKTKGNENRKGFCGYLAEAPGEGQIVISVTDNGCGIKEEDQAKLFKPFTQANSAVQVRYGGTGLGLWISQKLATGMRGSITCRSQVNSGSTFTVTIPAKCKSAKEAANVPSFVIGSTSSRRDRRPSRSSKPCICSSPHSTSKRKFAVPG